MEKKIKILVLISVILIILGPVLGLLLNKIILVDQSFVISETSNSDIQNATAIEFTLSKGQKSVIEFSVSTENITANLIILGKATYDQEYEDSTAPGSISGEKYFIYSEFAFGQIPISNQAHSDDIRSITNEGYWYIEFAGEVSGLYLRSVPGDYVIIVSGTNSGGLNLNIYFDLVVKIDGPGEIIGMLLTLVGIGMLVAILVIGTMSYLKKTGRGLL